MLRSLVTMATIAIGAAIVAAQPPPLPFPVLGPPGGANLDFTNGPAVLAYIRSYVELVLRDPDPSTSLARQQELERLLARLPTGNAAQKDTLAAATKHVSISR
jgi:hypothetical protein